MLLLRILLFSGLVFHKLIWEIWKRRFPLPSQGKRSTGLMKRMVKLAKIAVLIFFLIQTLFLNVFPIGTPHPFVRIAGLFLFVTGLAIAVAGRIQLGKSWKDLEDLHAGSQQEMITHGIYSYIRHPIYAGDILLIVGLELALESWLVLATALIALVVVRQASQEEKLLAAVFPKYSEYCSLTKRFIPFLY